MRSGWSGGWLLACAGLGLVTALGAWAEVERGRAGPQVARRVVLLELFTSQGCSSCPPADRLLARLAREGSVDGIAVVPLAFHVDYWNYIGWTDPFSSPRWSERQRGYAHSFRLRSVYTPQLVVDGSFECNGADERRVRDRVRAAAERPPAASVELARVELGGSGRWLELEVAARLLAEAGDRGFDLVVALFENGLVTPVESGENARHTLANESVVRLLRPVATLTADRPEARRSLRLDLEPAWAREKLAVAAFVQARETLAIGGAALARIDPG